MDMRNHIEAIKQPAQMIYWNGGNIQPRAELASEMILAPFTGRKQPRDHMRKASHFAINLISACNTTMLS
jgi:hypothetical protein